MTKLAGFCGAAALTLMMASPASAVVIFQDDFTRVDSNAVGNGWVESDGGAGSAIIQIVGGELAMFGSTDPTITQGTLTLSTLGLTNIVLSYDFRRSDGNTNQNEVLEVYWAPSDGGVFTLVNTHVLPAVSTSFTSVLPFLLTGAENLPDIAIRFHAELGGNDRLRIDNVLLQGTEVPLPAALPLYGTGLGLMGLFGWWRRRRAVAA